MDNNLLEGLINDSFDRHYKLIQSLRNQYLSMIRLILKNKRQNNLTLEEILAYHDIEKKLLDVRKDISTLINNKYTNLTPPDDNDVKMVKTLKAFLPFMIAFYNAQHTIQEKEKQNKNQNQNQNQNLETATFIPVAPPLD
jgi:hypothetical protein